MEIITTTASLDALVARLQTEKPAFLALDTEFERERTYWPQLCLVQIATPEKEVFLIDPLASGLSLEALGPLLTNPDIVKVFHAARQDIEVLYHVFGVMVAPLFDTQIAAMVCGLGESVSYESLVHTLVKERLDKSARMTDWSKRPLSPQQQLYAGNDVLYLAPLYEKIRAQLESDQRLGWVQEEADKLLCVDLYEIDPQKAWERLNVRCHTPLQQMRLQRLAAWRETQARARNMPRSRLLKTEAMEELIALTPTCERDFERVRALKQRPLSAQDRAVVLALLQPFPGEEDPALSKPFARAPHGCPALVTLLKFLLAHEGQRQKVAPSLIALTKDLEAFALNPTGAHVDFLHGWRREVFGGRALDLVEGKLQAFFHEGQLCFEPRPPVR